MSVTTTFDEKIIEAKEYTHKAFATLQECVNEDTWGYQDMSSEYIDKVYECIKMLIDIKRKL